MRLFLIPALIVLASLVIPPSVFAQDSGSTPGKSKNRPFKSADSDDEKAAVGVEVVRPDRVTELKSWQPGKSSLPAKGYPDITLIADSVQLLSSGVMRWTFAVYNKGEEGRNFLFSMGRSYLADEQGEKYEVIAQEFPPNYGEYTKLGLHAGTKKRFYLDFKAPVRPTSAFRVGIILEGGFSTQPNAFAPFVVRLEQPLYYDNGAFEPKKAAPAPQVMQGNFGGNRDANGDANGLAGPVDLVPPHICRSPKQLEEQEQKFRDLSEGGLRFDGNLFLSQGQVHSSGRILFKTRERSDFVEVTIVSLTGTPRTFELFGAFFEDPRSETGLVLKLRDNAKVVTTLKLEGNVLIGTDTLGNRYSFRITAKK